ncbi:hypothetical protein H2199_006390 [Coniosporium tulheliwenetii]|uniref:Uncharacterized protein n=1 Tax=Coniosporium tulheliwenetii TaxID=3383036 RepID=A0ACC2YVD5_9PEZI|nr:hypothetical protein H2199_006390 [Cladosporium sp. JES 115]
MGETNNHHDIDIILRKTAIVDFAIGFILLIIHGPAADQGFPAIGLIPLAGSALLSYLLLCKDKHVGHIIQINIEGSLKSRYITITDAVTAFTLLLVLICSWAALGRRWQDSGLIILGTYGTVLIMISCGIHFYFFLSPIIETYQKGLRYCQHCRGTLNADISASCGSKGKYAAVPDDEEAGGSEASLQLIATPDAGADCKCG